MDQLKRELVEIRRARATQRKDRQRTPVPNCAIVGYTNAGKSSLLRLLTGADVLVEDKLFATLGTTTRKVALPSHQPLLLTDTVGFVRKLPHRLVEAFKATLEEATQADFLVHLLDASAPEVVQFHRTTLDVLEELGAGERPAITVFNKVDKVADPAILHRLRGLCLRGFVLLLWNFRGCSNGRFRRRRGRIIGLRFSPETIEKAHAIGWAISMWPGPF